VERVLPQLREHTGLAPEKTEFWHPIEQLPAEFPPADRKRLAAAYRRKIETVIEPAYRRMVEFLSKEYLPHARDTVGLGQMPGGRALYDYDVRYHTTTRLTPEEIHALGHTEVTRIEGELAKVQASVGFTGGLQDFYAHVRSDASQKFTAMTRSFPPSRLLAARSCPGSPHCSMCCRGRNFRFVRCPSPRRARRATAITPRRAQTARGPACYGSMCMPRGSATVSTS
jgi:hypothetical protein